MSQGPQASQLGLFSTQVAEQIHRLRSLGKEEVPGEPIALRVRRAIMATRLLGGSARLLKFAPLQAFLDDFLVWLQQLEGLKESLGASQSLILDSVIELEEKLLRQFETEGAAADPSASAEELTDLSVLLRRDTESRRRKAAPSEEASPESKIEIELGPEELFIDLDVDSIEQHELPGESEAPADPVPETPAPAVPEAAADPREELREALHRAEHGLRGLREVGDLDAERPWIEAWWRRCGELVDLNPAVENAAPAVETPAAASFSKDPDEKKFHSLHAAVDAEAASLERPLRLRCEGRVEDLGPSVRDLVMQILEYLLVDCTRVFKLYEHEQPTQHGDHELWLELSRDGHLLNVQIRDNAPPLTGRDQDHLMHYRGLRRAHDLIGQLGGILEVEPSDRGGCRFQLQLPSALGQQSYRVFQVESSRFALPAVGISSSLEAAGLMYESDRNGDSLHLDGRVVPVMDLASEVVTLLPVDEPGLVILAGYVEKRLGIYADRSLALIETDELGDPPAGWDGVAYGSLSLDGQAIPILDVERLLALRFRSGAADLPGGSQLDELDSYMPVDQTERIEPLRQDGPGKTAVLVNQSSFRRKEIGRILRDMGYSVSAVPDLASARPLVEELQADVLITDLRLGQEGGEALARLRSGAQLPVILTSSVAREYAEELARRAGANACWMDPFRPADLAAILQQVA